MRHSRQSFVFGTGLLLLFTGIVCNHWWLAKLVSPDGVIDQPLYLAVIWIFQFVTILFGVFLICFRKSTNAAKLLLAVVFVGITTPLAGELTFRTAIALGVEHFRNPGLYSDSLSDDNFWKLQYLWSGEERNRFSMNFASDELLGWAPQKTEDNPLGVIADKPYVPRFDKPAVLFFGDSFVGGAVPFPGQIPQQLDLLTPCPVYNFGVSGYGVDQIFLHLKSSHEPFAQPFLLIGLLTADLDRCVLTFRGAPKPYFVRQEGLLQLRGVPLTLNADQWISKHPPRVPSFFFAFARRQYGLHREDWHENSHLRTEKEQLNQLILEQLVKHLTARQLPALFVLFYGPLEFQKTGWREEFLTAQMRRWQLDYLDTKQLLLDAATRQSCEIADFYLPDFHLNRRGNTVVARALDVYLEDRSVCRELPEQKTPARKIEEGNEACDASEASNVPP